VRPRLLHQAQQAAQVRLKNMSAVEKCRKIEVTGPITPQHAEIRLRLLTGGVGAGKTILCFGKTTPSSVKKGHFTANSLAFAELMQQNPL
jgi:hypothetical protein